MTASDGDGGVGEGVWNVGEGWIAVFDRTKRTGSGHFDGEWGGEKGRCTVMRRRGSTASPMSTMIVESEPMAAMDAKSAIREEGGGRHVPMADGVE